MHGQVRPPSRLPAVHMRPLQSTKLTKTLSPSAPRTGSHPPSPVRWPAITARSNVRPPSWLAATTTCIWFTP